MAGNELTNPLIGLNLRVPSSVAKCGFSLCDPMHPTRATMLARLTAAMLMLAATLPVGQHPQSKREARC
jgi:hypothetical protein